MIEYWNDHRYSTLMTRLDEWERNYYETYSKAAHHPTVPAGYSSRIEFMNALTVEYEEHRAELKSAIHARLVELGVES